MSVAELQLKLHETIDGITDQKVLNALYVMLKENQLPDKPMSLEYYIQTLDESRQQVQEGKFSEASDFEKESDNWWSVLTVKIIWTDKAKLSLKEIYDYLKLDSVPVAKRVKAEIIAASNKLVLHPEKYQTDEFYPNNPGNIRRFFKWSYRIV